MTTPAPVTVTPLKVISGTIDPTSVATDAEIGTIYIKTDTNKIYVKQDDGSTINWTQQGDAIANVLANYVPKTPTDWASTAPISVQDALDRVAALLKTLNSGNPVP